MIYKDNDKIKLITYKNKTFYITLKINAKSHTHFGIIVHNEIIGKKDGLILKTNIGIKFIVFKLTMYEYILHMPRKTGIIYPKDISQIIVFADIFPDAQIIEVGLGSGGLAIALLRSLGKNGFLYSFEKKENLAILAKKNVYNFFNCKNIPWKIIVGDFSENLHQIEKTKHINRLILDVLKPWKYIKYAFDLLQEGSLILCYVTNTNQLSDTVNYINDTKRFVDIKSYEIIQRDWYVKNLSTRPSHKNFGHTGFLIFAKYINSVNFYKL